MIRPFPDLEEVKIWWNAETDVRLIALEAAQGDMHEDNNATLVRGPTLLAKATLAITTCQQNDLPVSDESKITQLGYLLRQLQFPMLTRFECRFGQASGLHTSDSAPLWLGTLQAFRNCKFPVLETLNLHFDLSHRSGGAIGIDFSVSTLSDHFRHKEETA